jgi:two-component system, LuxR family, sensor kinase FixL
MNAPATKIRIRRGRPGRADFEAIFRSAADGIIIIDDRGMIQAFNPAAERLFGYRPAEVLGQDVTVLMPMPYRAMHHRALSAHLRGRPAQAAEMGREGVGRKKDGTMFPLHLSMSEVRRAGRLRFVGIVHDLTGRRRLQQAIVKVSEDVRRQIGQEIHDVLGQQLTTISLLTHAGASGNARRLMAEIHRLTGEAMQQARRLAHGLYPAALERHGLCAALEEMAVTFRRTTSADCRYVGVSSGLDVPPETALHLYRIAQEALTNAVRHGQARSITIDLREGRDGLVLSVEDNGRGLRRGRPEAGTGIGVPIMKYRAAVLGGDLSVRRRSPQGVCVRCRIADWPRPPASVK